LKCLMNILYAGFKQRKNRHLLWWSVRSFYPVGDLDTDLPRETPRAVRSVLPWPQRAFRNFRLFQYPYGLVQSEKHICS
jgi:hypothetical protein